MQLFDPVPSQLIERVRGEYLEMPGLKLTPVQARRLWSLDDRVCERVLTALVQSKFLAKTRDGSFVLQATR